MAASRSEVEVLLKMRAEGAQALDLFSGGLGKVTTEGTKASKVTDEVDKATKRTEGSSMAASVALGVLAERAIRGVVGGFAASVNAANQLDSALTGLDSVSRGMGLSLDASRNAAKSLAADGLMTVTEAADGLKNLLSSGFSLPEAIQLMNTFRDSAAFNRQGMLGFGESVVRATQGIKFNNSALTDSTGLGKNLSKIMTDAGMAMDAAGNAAQDAGVRQVILNGFVKEGAIFQGNAAKYAESNAGAMAQMSAASQRASQSIGKQLQPAVAAFSRVAQPLLGIVERYPGLFVAAGIAVGGLVAPLLLVKAAAMLGLPPMSALGAGALAMGRAFTAASLGATASQLGAVSGAAGSAAVAVGSLGIAAAAVGVAFAGWKLGSLIGNLDIVSSNVARIASGLGLGLDPALQKTYEAGLGMDLLARASKEAGRSITTVSEAAKIMGDVEAIRLAKFNQTIEVQKRAVEAERDLGRISQQTAQERLLALDAEQRIQDVAKNRVSLAASIATAERQVQGEIKATGLSVGELVKRLREDEGATKKWLETKGVSAETIQYLTTQIKKQDDAQKKSKQTTEEAKRAADEQRQSLEQLGLVTKTSVNLQLAEFAKMEALAVKEGIPLDTVLDLIRPKLIELAKAAKTSGLDVGEIAVQIDRASGATRRWLAGIQSLPVMAAGTIPQVGTEVRLLTRAELDAQLAVSDLSRAYDTFGLKSRAELQRTAAESQRAYALILKDGKATPEQIAEAFKKMSEDVNAANGTIPSKWQTEILPGIRSALGSMRDATASTLAEMLLGTRGFSDGWRDIWGGMKQTVLQILSDLLSQFINSFLRGMLGAITGQKGAFGAAFGSLFSGAGGGGMPGAGGFNLGGLFGGGKPGGGMSWGGDTSLVKGGTNWGGAALGAGVGLGAGYGLGNRFGTGAGVAGGMLGGAASGFAFGGPIGAGIGAIGGLIGGLVGGAKNNTKDARAQFAQQLGFRDVDALFAALKEQAPDQADELRNRALNVIGKKDNAANQRWMEDVTTALKKAADAASLLAGDVDGLGLSWEDMGQSVRAAKIDELGEGLVAQTARLVAAGYEQDKVLAKQAGGYSELYAKAIEYNETIPEAMRPMLQRLIEMGLLVDANGDKITELGKDMFDSAKVSSSAIDSVKKTLGTLGGAATAAANGIRDAFGRLTIEPITVPWRYTEDGGDGGPPNRPGGRTPGEGEQTPGGAASGIFARNPTLAVFGEGGEPEVGGPKSFFADVFRSLGLTGIGDQGAGQSAGGDSLSFTFNVVAMNADGLRSGVEQEIIPMIIDALRINRRQSRTDMRAALGVSE